MQSDVMIGNGLPVLRYPASEPSSSSSPPTKIVDPPREPGKRPRKKRKKQATEQQQKTMLYHMNNNIRTLRRVRDVHARLTVLKDSNNDDAPGGAQPPELLPPPPLDDLGDAIDDKPWSVPASGLDIGEENADSCLHWTGSKVLEHAGFQGTSKVALDVLAGVTADYLLNVGRTIRFLSDKYGQKMTPEVRKLSLILLVRLTDEQEIVLHTLFESGVTRIHDLERYIKEDVVRYGSRMADLEKKLSNAYAEAVRAICFTRAPC